MKTINRVDIVRNITDEITVFDSELTRYFDRNGINLAENLIKIRSDVPAGKNQKTEMDYVFADLTHYCATGYNFNGKTMKPFMAAASDVRKATSSWVNQDVLPDLWTWAMCGLTTKDLNDKIAINKYMAYIGLLASASKPFAEVFGRKIDIRRVAIIKDGSVDVDGIMDVVLESGVVDHVKNRIASINAFDGFGVINSAITKGKSCTLRGPWIKAFAQAVKWNELSRMGKKFVDFWGNEIALQDVDVILTESCFKAVKLYVNWNQYCEAFERLGHTICVCVQEHEPKLKGMPYQQGQTLAGDENDAKTFAEFAKSKIDKLENPEEAIDLLPKYQRGVAEMYRPLLKEAHTARTLQEKYTAKRIDMLGGRIPELGYNAFLAPDVVAFAQHLFGLPVTGSLKAGECACSTCMVGDVDVTRNPHLDNAHVVLKNVGLMDLVPEKSPTMFINIFDLTTIRLRADYDGDHVWFSQQKILLDLIAKTYAAFQNIPVDWDVAKAPKSKINKAAVAGFISNLLKGSEIGLYADALTKMWNSGYNRDVCDWLTYAGNVLIDAAKHATVKIEKPEAVKDLDGASLPEFCRYAKADKEHPAESPYWDEIKKSGAPRVVYSGSFLDMYSRKVKEIVPEILTINGIEDDIFDIHMMLIDPHRKLGKLADISRKAKELNEETGEYDDGGVFQKIAFRHSSEWKQILKIDEDASMKFPEWEAMKANEAKKELIAWAREQYADNPAAQSASDDRIWDAIYDIVTRNIFSVKKCSEGYDTVVKSTYWRVFGKKAVEVTARNLDKEISDNFFDELEDDDLAF